MKLRQIEVDFDIHKMIEMERSSFEETPNAALRRLLGLPSRSKKDDELPTEQPSKLEVQRNGLQFVEDGVSVPHGSEARMKYQRGQQEYHGIFFNGKLVVDGVEYSALSPAAKALAVTKNGTHPKELNGWLYWEVRFPGEVEWKKMDDLRKESTASIELDIDL